MSEEMQKKDLYPEAGFILVHRQGTEDFDRDAFERSGVEIFKPDEKKERDALFNPFATVLRVGRSKLVYGQEISCDLQPGDEIVIRPTGWTDIPLQAAKGGQSMTVTIIPFEGVMARLVPMEEETQQEVAGGDPLPVEEA